MPLRLLQLVSLPLFYSHRVHMIQLPPVPALDVYCNNTGAERLACLQALPADTLLNITNTVGSWLAVVDDVYTVNDTVSQVSQGPSGINSVSYMAGFMPEEGQSFVAVTSLLQIILTNHFMQVARNDHCSKYDGI